MSRSNIYKIKEEVKISPYVLPGLLIPGRGITFNLIEHVVLNSFHSNNEETIRAIKSTSRKREYAEVRQVIFYFAYIYLKFYPLSQIGKKYKRNHATVLHSVKVVKSLCETNKSFNNKIQGINTLLKNHLKHVVKNEKLESEVLLTQKRSKITIEDYGINDQEVFG